MQIAAGWDASAQAWIKNVEVDATRLYVLDAPMLAECGDVDGKPVLDAGCGEGRFSRMLTERGAVVSGIDPTVDFIDLAKQKHPGGDYRVGFAENLPYDSESFDLVISYLVILDVDDYLGAISEMARVLKPGGRIVLANLQSFATTRVDPWVEDESGNRLHLAVDNYSEERGDAVAWNGISIINYHRPLSSYLNAFINQGLVLTRFLEPLPSAEAVEKIPRLSEYLRIPFMLVMTWSKPV